MNVVVQKYGGTSVADVERIKRLPDGLKQRLIPAVVYWWLYLPVRV